MAMTTNTPGNSGQAPSHANAGPGRIFIQVGAGAGDQDSRAEFRDGFTETVKKLELGQTDRIILVEPNPLNIAALKKCWAEYPQASIHQVGIVPRNMAGKPLTFYYTDLDAPHFQVASFNPDHVLKHYRNLSVSDLRTIEVGTIDLNTFIDNETQGRNIEVLCLDIEGLDAEVLLDTNFGKMNVNFVSFEHLHLGSDADAVAAHFEKSGYRKIGLGVDHNGYDHLYQKVASA